ncbi:mCG144911, partial [Mus musculus]
STEIPTWILCLQEECRDQGPAGTVAGHEIKQGERVAPSFPAPVPLRELAGPCGTRRSGIQAGHPDCGRNVEMCSAGAWA